MGSTEKPAMNLQASFFALFGLAGIHFEFRVSIHLKYG